MNAHPSSTALLTLLPGRRDADRLRSWRTARARFGGLLRLRTINLRLAQRTIGLPCNALRIRDPVLVRSRIAARRVRLIERRNFGIGDLLSQRRQLFVGVDLESQMIQAGSGSAL